MSVREYRLRPYQVTFREFGDRTTSRGCARRQSTYTERVDRRGSRPGARGQHMGGGGWSRADPVAHKQTRARFLFVGTAAAQCCPARRGRRGARSTGASRRHAPRLQRDRVHHVEDSRRHRQHVPCGSIWVAPAALLAEPGPPTICIDLGAGGRGLRCARAGEPKPPLTTVSRTNSRTRCALKAV